MDKRITVVLADANEEFRTALKQALEATGEFDVVGCAADGLAAAQDIAEGIIDDLCILVDQGIIV